MYEAVEDLREPTSAEQETAYADLLRDRIENPPTEGIAARTHPRHAPTKNRDTVFLESFIYGVPDQAAPDHGSSRCRIVGHLGEPSGVDMDTLRRREPKIWGMTTTLHLRHQEVE